MVHVEYGNSVVGRSVLKYHQESTIAESPWIFLVRDSAIAQEFAFISVREMLALREQIVPFIQMMGGDQGNTGFAPNFIPCGTRSGHDD
jgi:hypothetical protein